jgi:hypothetical protein
MNKLNILSKSKISNLGTILLNKLLEKGEIPSASLEKNEEP